MIIGSRTKLIDITEFKVEVNDILLKQLKLNVLE